MISQNCPKCASNRIRRGYRPTPIWLKIFFRYYLLCDNCNWEFTGFAVPGTVSSKPTKKNKKKNQVSNLVTNESAKFSNGSAERSAKNNLPQEMEIERKMGKSASE